VSSSWRGSPVPIELLTLANQLTLLRIVLVPVFALCMLYGLPGWALLVFTVAGVTDLFDGLIARLSGRPTTIGAWLDPMADKLLLVTMFVMLTLPGMGLANRLPLWLTVLVISRDLGIVLTVAIVNLAVARRTFRPSLLGKAATLVYVVTGVYTLYANYEGEPSRLVKVLEYVCLALTVASAAHYLVLVARTFKPGAAGEGVL
jgi:cardiolipin synthase